MTATVTRPRHPAQFTPSILEVFAELLADLPAGALTLDPFAGLGDRARAMCNAHGWRFVGVELEAGWASIVQGDATALPFPAGVFDAAFTSVTYANGLADRALGWSDPKGRRTYDLFLGRPLSRSNTGAVGIRGRTYDRYRELHRAAFAGLLRVLKPGALFLLNCSDVVHAGALHPVTGDNVTDAVRAGFDLVGWRPVGTPRYRNGSNSDARAPHEDVVTLRKPVTS